MVWSTFYRKIKSRGVTCISAAQNVMDHNMNTNVDRHMLKYVVFALLASGENVIYECRDYLNIINFVHYWKLSTTGHNCPNQFFIRKLIVKNIKVCFSQLKLIHTH